jgi:hypothetical protein
MVRQSLETHLVDRGFNRTDDGPTDFRVAFELGFRGSESRLPASDQRGLDGQPSGAADLGQTGVLTVRMLHPETSKVLWEGRLSGFTVGAANQETDIGKAVWRVLVEFPPITG